MAKTREQIVNEARRICAEIDQIFIDAEAYNEIHPDRPDIDPDPDGEMSRIRTSLGKMLMHEKVA